MAEETPMFRVNGKDYAIPADLDLGEMCDAERYFGVEFGENATSGIRMAAALLWIAIRRDDPSVSVDDIRALPMSTFEGMVDADPPPPAGSGNDNAEKHMSSGNGSEPSGDVPAVDPKPIGAPG